MAGARTPGQRSLALAHSAMFGVPMNGEDLDQSEQDAPSVSTGKVNPSYVRTQNFRWVFKFDDIALRPPAGFIFVDEALDAIGEARYPETWGRLPHFGLMPLTHYIAHFTWWDLVQDSDGWQLQPTRIEGYDSASLSNYTRWFSVVVRRFVEAAEADAFRLRYLHSVEGLLPGHLRHGVVSAQVKMITNVGRARTPGSTLLDQPALIVVEEASFLRWLSSTNLFADDDDDLGKRLPGVGTLQWGAQAVVQWAIEQGYPVTKEWLWDVVSADHPNMPRNLFDKRIWRELQSVSRQKGPPNKDRLEARDAARDTAVGRFRAASSAKTLDKP